MTGNGPDPSDKYPVRGVTRTGFLRPLITRNVRALCAGDVDTLEGAR
ncbi:MAG TPA: hypothetical protein VGO46_10100 [Gemmatimonadaceae bacterium]|nr:hypothetical protein [Gemmatimonadaceae bacterium]